MDLIRQTSILMILSQIAKRLNLVCFPAPTEACPYGSSLDHSGRISRLQCNIGVPLVKVSGLRVLGRCERHWLCSLFPSVHAQRRNMTKTSGPLFAMPQSVLNFSVRPTISPSLRVSWSVCPSACSSIRALLCVPIFVHPSSCDPVCSHSDT